MYAFKIMFIHTVGTSFDFDPSHPTLVDVLTAWMYRILNVFNLNHSNHSNSRHIFDYDPRSYWCADCVNVQILSAFNPNPSNHWLECVYSKSCSFTCLISIQRSLICWLRKYIGFWLYSVHLTLMTHLYITT
jgi:hypothetical protein